jgi:predicted transcriptional regulator
MASKDAISLTKHISLVEKEGTFSTLFHKKNQEKISLDAIQLRNLLSNERARIINLIKTKQPESIYQLGRNFKAVRQDIRLLEKFGIVELTSSHKNGRERIQPVIGINELQITLTL